MKFGLMTQLTLLAAKMSNF